MVFNFRPHRLPPQRTSMAYQIIANRDELSKNLPPSFTETAPTEEQNSFKSAKRWFGDSISTWRATSSIGCGIATFVFVFNVIILIWACATSEIIDGIAIVYRGTLLKSRTIGVTAHLVINILSSLILVSSNKCVQYLSSPTRRDVNKAHAHRSWVDIGIRSLRNFKAVRGWRMWVSILLAVSSLPLHLIYNSVIITSQAGYDSVAVNVNKDFLSGGPWNHTRPLPVYQLGQEQNLTSLVQHLQNEAVANNLLQLEPTQCVDILNPKYQSIYRNLLILTDGLYNPDNSVWTIIGYNVSSPGKPRMEGWWLESSGPGSFQDNFYGFEARPPEVPVNNCTYETNTTCWLTYCTDTLTDGTCGSYADSMVGMTPEYCLVEVASEDCIVGISIVFLVVVIIANALKAGSLLYGYFKKEFIPLATTGDALSSFLTHPDPTTAGLGPLSALEISKAGFSTTTSGSNRTVRKRPYRWFKAPEPFRWYLGTLSLLLPLALLGLALYWNIGYAYVAGTQAQSSSDLVYTGGGGPFLENPPLIVFGHSFTAVAILANLPQLILTGIYICCNDLLTSMLLVHEYHQFATRRKPLRVTQRKGQQRSTYFLSLPLKYAVPLLVFWTAVHWFISDTVYLTGIDIYNHYGVLDQERSFTGLSMNGGWVVYLAPTIVVLQLVLVLLGCRKLKRGMPLARTNSLALSAACHHAPDDTDAALLPIMYGVINPSHDDGVEYVGFSSKPVQNLEAEVAYSSYGNMHQENQWWRAGRSSGMSPVDDTGEEAFELLRRT